MLVYTRSMSLQAYDQQWDNRRAHTALSVHGHDNESLASKALFYILHTGNFHPGILGNSEPGRN